VSPVQVFFTPTIAPEAVVAAYDALGLTLPGRVGVKVHSGEVGNQNFTRPDFVKPVVDHVGGIIVEANTAYAGGRNSTAKHWQTLKRHGWTDIAQVDLLDEDGEVEWPIPSGTRIHTDFVGSHLPTYDSLLVLTHFKGHPMGGFGGALKNIAIGLASAHGKRYIHGAGDTVRLFRTAQDQFLDAMADASRAIVDHFPPGRAAYVSVMKNLSVDCDCCAVAEDPAMADIGILSSTDPVALDQACIDLVYGSADPGRTALIKRIESKQGLRILETAAALGVGSREYELVRLEGDPHNQAVEHVAVGSGPGANPRNQAVEQVSEANGVETLAGSYSER